MPTQRDIISALEHVTQVVMGTIILVGFIGNGLILSCYASSRRLKNQSTTPYLLSLALSDLCFLLSLMTIWLQTFQVKIADIQGFCQLSNYLSYVSCALSGWFIVAFTAERFIVVYRPFYRVTYCTYARALKISIAIGILGLIYNCWVLVVLTPRVYYTPPIFNATNGSFIVLCDVRTRFARAFDIFGILDTALSFSVPMALIFIMNILISRQLFLSRTMRARLVSSFGSTCSAMPSVSIGTAAHLNGDVVQLNERGTYRTSQRLASQHDVVDHRLSCAVPVSAQGSPNTPVKGTQRPGSVRHSATQHRYEYRVTATLLITSATYLVLNLPSYASRLYTTTGGLDLVSQQIVDTVSHLMFYFQFSANFFIYAAGNPTFRDHLLKKCAGSMLGGRRSTRSRAYYTNGGSTVVAQNPPRKRPPKGERATVNGCPAEVWPPHGQQDDDEVFEEIQPIGRGRTLDKTLLQSIKPTS